MGTRALHTRLVGAVAVALVGALPVLAAPPASAEGVFVARAEVRAKPARAKVVWGATSWVAGAGGYAVSGKVHGRAFKGGKRTVLLQYKIPGGWRTLNRDKVRRKKFAFAGIWDWYGTHKVRVFAPKSKKRKARTLGKNLFSVGTAWTPRGVPSEYVTFQNAGHRYGFNPCRPIRWRFNNGGGVGDAYFTQVQAAVTEVSRATGIPFVYQGASATIPLNVTALEAGTDLVVAFADEAQVPAFAGATARGGVVKVKPAWGLAAGKRVAQIEQAGVTVSNEKITSDYYDSAVSSPKPTTILVFLHELGHAMGLDHVTTPGSEVEVMYSGDGYMTPWPDGLHHPYWGAGDLAGLSAVGLGGGCVR